MDASSSPHQLTLRLSYLVQRHTSCQKAAVPLYRARLTSWSAKQCIPAFLNVQTVLGRPLIKRLALCYRPLSCLSVCDVGVLWQNGSTDQDETWHAGRPPLWPYCVRWGPTSPSPKEAQPSISGPYLLWPNG